MLGFVKVTPESFEKRHQAIHDQTMSLHVDILSSIDGTMQSIQELTTQVGKLNALKAEVAKRL